MDVVGRVHDDKVECSLLPAGRNLKSLYSRDVPIGQPAIHDTDAITSDHCLRKQIRVLYKHTTIDIGPLLADLDTYTCTRTRRGNRCSYERTSYSGERVQHGHARFCEELYQQCHKLWWLIGTVLFTQFMAIDTGIACVENTLCEI